MGLFHLLFTVVLSIVRYRSFYYSLLLSFARVVLNCSASQDISRSSEKQSKDYRKQGLKDLHPGNQVFRQQIFIRVLYLTLFYIRYDILNSLCLSYKTQMGSTERISKKRRRHLVVASTYLSSLLLWRTSRRRNRRLIRLDPAPPQRSKGRCLLARCIFLSTSHHSVVQWPRSHPLPRLVTHQRSTHCSHTERRPHPNEAVPKCFQTEFYLSNKNKKAS